MAVGDRVLVDAVGFSDKELSALLEKGVVPKIAVAGYERGVPELDEPDMPEPPKDPVTKPGDAWTLGRHRLVCGSSEDAGVWKSTVRGEPAHALWTDPPYGVNMEEKNEAIARMSQHKNAQKGRTIANDELSVGQLTDFLRRVFANAIVHTREGAVWYVAGPPGPHSLAFGTALHEIGVWRQTIVWVKDSLVLGRSDYHYRCEFLFYGWKPGAAHRGLLDRKQDNVWEIPRPKKSPDHPTMKPLELVARALVNSTDKGEVIVDCFGGSGTTLLAAEQLERTVRMIELSPGYCDVIVERWQDLTGGKALRARA